MYSHFDEVPAGFQFVEHLDVTQEDSECIAVEDDDEGGSEEEATTKPTKAKRAGKKTDADAEADEAESSASEQEEEVKEADVEDDPLFSRKRKSDGKEKLAAQHEVVDDDFDVVVEEEKAAPTSVVAANGKKKDVKLEQLTDEQIEKGSATQLATLIRCWHSIQLLSMLTKVCCSPCWVVHYQCCCLPAHPIIPSFVWHSAWRGSDDKIIVSSIPVPARLPYRQLGQAQARLHRRPVCWRQSRLCSHRWYDTLSHTENCVTASEHRNLCAHLCFMTPVPSFVFVQLGGAMDARRVGILRSYWLSTTPRPSSSKASASA